MTAAMIATRLGLDPAFPLLKEHIIASTGLAYYLDKDADLAERIAPRFTHLSIADCGAYLSLLKDRDAGEAERRSLVDLLTIGETYFFRHQEQFDALRDVVFPDVIERNQATRTLRIWSAGCATGAEPYSIAILLREHFAMALAGWHVQVVGTDINRTFLARAERGHFDERALRSASDEFKRQWFTPAGRLWSVIPSVREWVSFQHHNLVEHPYSSVLHGPAFDLIVCRNVMIYFDWTVIRNVLGQFHQCLADGGWLAVGHAESNPDLFHTYRTVSAPGATLYQKRSADRPTRDASASFWSASSLTMAMGRQPGREEPFVPAVPVAAVSTWPRPVVSNLEATSATEAAPQLTGLALVRRFAEEGKWQEASHACAPLLHDEKLNPVVHFYHGLILEHSARDLEAEQAFRRTLYLDRTFVLAHYHVAMLLKKRGDRAAATQSLRNVQRLLSSRPADEPIPNSDGLTAEDVSRLASQQLELLS